MRSQAKKLLTQYVQEAFSYELSLNRPVDPNSGSNATIETNPEAVKYLIDATEGRRILDEAYSKMTVRATYEFLTPVGYHGLVNSSAIGAGFINALEALSIEAEASILDFNAVLAASTDASKAWTDGLLASNQSDPAYEQALRELNANCFSYADLTDEMNFKAWEFYQIWGKLWSGDPFKTLLDEWYTLDGDGIFTRVRDLLESLEDRLSCIEGATPIWAAHAPIERLDAILTVEHGTIIDTLGEVDYTNPNISFFVDSATALLEKLKERQTDNKTLERYQASLDKLIRFATDVYPRDYVKEARSFQELGRALVKATIVKKYGQSLNVSQEGIDDLYHVATHGTDKRATLMPIGKQTYDGLVSEAEAIYAVTLNQELSPEERKVADLIFDTKSLTKLLDDPKLELIKDIDPPRFNAIRRDALHHQSINGDYGKALRESLKGKSKVPEIAMSFWNWVEAGFATNDTMAKAVEQFATGHREYGVPCFEACERALERAKRYAYFDQMTSSGKNLVERDNPPKVVEFEELSEGLVNETDKLASLFLSSTIGFPKARKFLEKERISACDMLDVDRLNVSAGCDSIKTVLCDYLRFIRQALEFLKAVENLLGSVACSARNTQRTKIHLLEMLVEKKGASFSMEALDDQQEIERLLAEGGTVSQEGIVDFFRKIFSRKKKRPESEELLVVELEEDSRRWKNPSALALINGGIREVPQELLAKLVAISKNTLGPSQWRTKQLKHFYEFACEVNKIEDIGYELYDELNEANDRKEVDAVLEKARKNINAFLALCKRYGIEPNREPQYVPVDEIELYRDVTSNMRASMTMFERGWSSREGGSWLIHETKYYGWFEDVLDDAFEHPVLSEIPEEELDAIKNEFSNLVSDLRDRFNWRHHPIYELELFLRRARIEVLKFAEQIEEKKRPNLVMENLDDNEVKRLLSEGVTVSQEGFIDLIKKLFAKKPEKPDQKLMRLEKEAPSWKNPAARALIEGRATELPKALEDFLVSLSKDDFAPCQWRSKQNKPFLDFYIEAAHTTEDNGEGFYSDLQKAKDRKTVEKILNDARKNIKQHIDLAHKHKMTLERCPTYVEVPVKELYQDVTARFADSVKLKETAGFSGGYFLVFSTQYYGWFFSTVSDLDAEGFEDFSEEETEAITDEFFALDEELDSLFDWSFYPDSDMQTFLKKGRLAVLEAAEAIEKGTELKITMEGFVGDLIGRLTGKKAPAAKTPVKEEVVGSAERPDKLGFGWDDGYEVAEEFVESTKGHGDNLNIEKLCDVKFRIPATLLSTPVANRNKILAWFETNAPEAKPNVESFYKVFDERVMAPDTAVLSVWNSAKHPRLVRLWSQVAKEISKYPFKDPSQSDFKNIVHFWAHNGFAELAKSELKVESLNEYRYGDLLDDLYDSRVKLTPLDYEKAATGKNPVYAQIGTLNTYRWWATANVIGEENFVASALFGKLEDKYMSVEYEWRAVLSDLIVLAWHIGNLSGKRA